MLLRTQGPFRPVSVGDARAHFQTLACTFGPGGHATKPSRAEFRRPVLIRLYSLLATTEDVTIASAAETIAGSELEAYNVLTGRDHTLAGFTDRVRKWEHRWRQRGSLQHRSDDGGDSDDNDADDVV